MIVVFDATFAILVDLDHHVGPQAELMRGFEQGGSKPPVILCLRCDFYAGTIRGVGSLGFLLRGDIKMGMIGHVIIELMYNLFALIYTLFADFFAYLKRRFRKPRNS